TSLSSSTPAFSLFSFFSMLPPPPSSPLFPYTTLFRSGSLGGHRQVPEDRRRRVGLRSVARWSSVRVHEEQPYDPGAGDLRRQRRSEERRVGKELRSRWSAEQDR